MINMYSLLYKCIRFLLKKVIFLKQSLTSKTTDLEEVVIIGQKLLSNLEKANLLIVPNITIKNSLEKDIYDLNFKNPLTFSSYESNLSLLNFFFKLGIAGGCYKTMMPNERSGNIRPRLQEVSLNNQPCLINAMGLPGPGAKIAIQDILKSELYSHKRPLGLSLGGESPQEYLTTFTIYNDYIKSENHPFYYELNISCPNTQKGKDLTNNISVLEDVLKQIRQQTHRVISVKVSPDQTNKQLTEIADMLTQFDSILINAGNTQFKSTKSVGLNSNDIAIGGGGLSGKALFSRTIEMIELFKPTKIPIIATGGIFTAEDVKICLSKGASLIGMATALALNPYTIPKILKEL